MARLERLDRIRIASPCDMRWEEMTGDDDRARHCSRCERWVYDLSKLRRAEAEALVEAREGERLCARFFRREDGRVMTVDCPVGAKERGRRLAMRFVRIGITAAAVVLAIVLCAPHVQPAVEGWLAENFPGWFGTRHSTPFLGYAIF